MGGVTGLDPCPVLLKWNETRDDDTSGSRISHIQILLPFRIRLRTEGASETQDFNGVALKREVSGVFRRGPVKCEGVRGGSCEVGEEGR